MGGFAELLSRDLRDLAGGIAFRIVAIALALLASGLAAGAAALILAPAGAAPALVWTLLYFATLTPFLVFVWAFAGPTLMKEKASGRLETLLATPLRARTVWLAKTATIALPGFAAAGLSAALFGIAAALAADARPGAAAFALPFPTALVCLVGNPLLFSGLAALTVVIAFRSNPDSAIVPSFALGFGLMTLIPVGTGLGIVDLASPAFAAAYVAAGAIEWLLVFILERGMTKERIVLSSRED